MRKPGFLLKALHTRVLSLASSEAEDKLKASPATAWILETTSFGTEPIDLIFFSTDGKILMYGSFRFLEFPSDCWKAPLSEFIFSVSEQFLYLITACLLNLPLSASDFPIVCFKICYFKVFENDLLSWRFNSYTSIFHCCWFQLSYRFSHFLYLCK